MGWPAMVVHRFQEEVLSPHLHNKLMKRISYNLKQMTDIFLLVGWHQTTGTHKSLKEMLTFNTVCGAMFRDIYYLFKFMIALCSTMNWEAHIYNILEL